MKKSIRITLCLAIAMFIFSACAKEYSCEQDCMVSNQPPVATAGADQTIALPVDSVILDGSTSKDPDGSIKTYQWAKLAGPASFTIKNTNSAKTSVNKLLAGSYLFELKVTDNGGLSAKDTMQVLVNDPSQANRPPVARAGNDTVINLPASTALLNGSASTDPDNNIISYKWTKLSGPASFSIARTDTVKTSVTNLAEGIYYFQLLVTDAGGLSSKDTVMIVIKKPKTLSNVIPVADAGSDQTLTLPLDSAYLDGSKSTPGAVSNDSAVYSWTQISGPAVSLVHPVLLSPPYIPTTMLAKNMVPGDYAFRLEVRTLAGSSFDTVKIKVVNDPQDLNTVTFHNLVWQSGDVYGLASQDIYITTSVRDDIFNGGPGPKPIKVYVDVNSTGSWTNIIYLSIVDPYYFDAAPEVLWVINVTRDFTLVGKRSDLKIKL